MLFLEMLKAIIKASVEADGDDLMLDYAVDNIKTVYKYSATVEFFEESIANAKDAQEMNYMDNVRHDQHEACISFVNTINREANSLGLPVLFAETDNREAVTKFCQMISKEIDDEIGRMLKDATVRNYFE